MNFELKVSGEGKTPEGPERGENKQRKVPHGEVKAGFRKILEKQKDTGENFSADEIAGHDEAHLSDEEAAALRRARRTPTPDKGHPGLHEQETASKFSQVRRERESGAERISLDETLDTDLHQIQTPSQGRG